jgi:hypothetical protein
MDRERKPMHAHTPPTLLLSELPRPWLFLAGAIDQDRAERWQDRVIDDCRELPGTILNPRRANWDPTWNQSLDDPHFAGQVAWELDGLEQADLVICFLPATAQARISLMEIGLHARRGRLLIGCESGFHSRSNVLAVGQRFGVPVVDTLPDLVAAAKERLAAFGIGAHV